MEAIRYTSGIPLKGSYDVVICGGGPSGLVAAIAAARNGARAALVEKYAFLGGMATCGLVAPISEFNKNGEKIIGGIPWEFVERLQELGGADLSYPMGNIPFDPELYKLTAQRMAIEAGVELYFGCALFDCTSVLNRIDTAFFTGRTGNFALRAECFIDCTGDGAMAFFSGAPFQELSDSAQLQPATLCFRLAGVDTEHLEGIRFRQPNTKYANRRVRAVLTGLAEAGVDVPNFGGPWFHWCMHDGFVTVNMTRARVSPDCVRDASAMECRLREDVFRLVALLKQSVPEFQNCFIAQTAEQAGYRESRRICGIHVLTGEELLGHTVFEDTIAHGAHPLDIHRADSTAQDVRFLEREGCIPYRSLVIEHFPNLIVAGRCISADRDAFASIRVQAPAMATGQAAGTAAALCCSEARDVTQINIHALQSKLLEQGAII